MTIKIHDILVGELLRLDGPEAWFGAAAALLRLAHADEVVVVPGLAAAHQLVSDRPHAISAPAPTAAPATADRGSR